MQEESALIVVRGVVQGVGFRFFAYHRAVELGLKGYVRNCMDGSVESHVEGPRGLIQEYVSALKLGPAHAHVTGLDVQWGQCKNRFETFRISY
ncbi:acylphosphatase [candidate division KSB1 bacterium]|nr:acylphosphatase [candidate division KSB1 bacterium]